ncbi:hypothetical protein SAMN05421542_0369 [Chryseobacterium jejuense]|uniref:Uncharacterized protein n=1 Tax=Chryseobacterium jejuense TaxID=445960 RepID=A0A2X2X3Y3_CHRJE|nr:hypothetical protein SAMN05421542_0369 [Chryseobacterium jejuense]SQB46637.1 Uncharacterised protein [Chryseobacterium jejuense]
MTGLFIVSVILSTGIYHDDYFTSPDSNGYPTARVGEREGLSIGG